MTIEKMGEGRRQKAKGKRQKAKGSFVLPTSLLPHFPTSLLPYFPTSPLPHEKLFQQTLLMRID
ncbi:MAG: hypothetical protein ACKO2T_04855, partial [Microcystis aeruginosa]